MAIAGLAASPTGLCARGQTVEICERDGLAVGKLDDDAQFTAHCLDIGAKRGQEEVATLLDARYAVLGNVQGFGHALLCQGMRFAQIAQRHLLFNESLRLRLDFALLIEGKPRDHVVECSRVYQLDLSSPQSLSFGATLPQSL